MATPLGDALGMTADAVLVPIFEVWAVDPATGSVLWTYGGPDGAAGTRDVATSESGPRNAYVRCRVKRPLEGR